MPQPAAGDPRQTPNGARTQVIYVMGSGHSGSTILGLTLGNCDGVFFAGELDNWLTRGGVAALGGTERTRFWSAVRERVSGAEPLFGDQATRNLERSSAALRLDRAALRRSLRPGYRRVAEQLYPAIADVSSSQLVVDSSHFPLRARELKKLEGLDVHVLFLLRDPDQVIHSFTRFMSRSAVVERAMRVLSKNLDIWLTHALSVWVFLRTPRSRRLLLTHEDFLADPHAVIRQILDFAGSDAGVPDLQHLRTGFPIQGNRLIHKDEVALVSTPPRRPALSFTRIAQLPFRPIVAGLRPRVSLGDDAER